MNSNYRVLHLVLGSTLIFLLISILDKACNFHSEAFRRINLISDLTPEKQLQQATAPVMAKKIPSAKGERELFLYKLPRQITNFEDTSLSSLPVFSKKLYELKTGQSKKIRIAYFGDSMIEGDLLTQTLRKLLQQQFGGHGVGYVPITSHVSKFRQTVFVNYSESWTDDNFQSSNGRRLFLSGHSFRSENGWVSMTDKTVEGSTPILEKSLLCGAAKKGTSIIVNGKARKISPGEIFNRIILASDKSKSMNFGVTSEQFPVYGISFESPTGVMVDNFSFRGITGIELNVFDTSFLQAIARHNNYDLIVLQYGVNMLFRPHEKEFDWYGENMLPGVKKFRKCFPNTEIIMVSTADRAFRYGSAYKSATGIDSLIHTQARIAFETNCRFYNQYETMGGVNSIVDWAGRKPSLANKDYIHPNHRGAELLATYFFEAIMRDYHKYVESLNK